MTISFIASSKEMYGTRAIFESKRDYAHMVSRPSSEFAFLRQLALSVPKPFHGKGSQQL